MNTKNIINCLVTFLCLFTFAAPQLNAQEVDDLQEYLDQLAAEQQITQRPRASALKSETITIPVGLTEVDLSKFTTYQNRKKVVTVKASVKFTNGTISASSDFAGGEPLLKIYGGATVALDETAGIDASNANGAYCTTAVGIYEGSTFYQGGDITAPSNGTGVAVYLDSSSDTYNYVSGTTTGSVSNPNGGTINGLETDPEAYAVLSTDKTSLTFYYDTKKGEREGTVYTDVNNMYDNKWYGGNFSTVVFDESFADYDGLTDMSYWFCKCGNLSNITGFEYVNTDNVTTMYFMFYGCRNLSTLDLRSFNTTKVESMGGMFSGCSNLTTIQVGNLWTTDNVTYSNSMFDGCTSLVGGDGTKFEYSYTDKTKAYAGIGGYLTMEGQEIGPEDYAVLSTDKTTLTFYYDTKKGEREGTVYTDVNNMYDNKWYGGNFSTVVFDKSFADYKGLTDMSYWFCKCGNLSSVTGLEYVNTDNVTTMTYMFYSCYNLNTLDLRSFNTAKVTNMGSMFNGCTNLTTIQVGNLWTTDNVTYSSSMFDGCTSLVGGDNTPFDYSYTDKTKAYAGVGGYLTMEGQETVAPEAYAVLSTDNTTLSFYYDGRKNSREGTVYTADMFRTNEEDGWGNDHDGALTTVIFDDSFANYDGLVSTARWFEACPELAAIIGIKNLKTSSVTDMSGMFYDCPSLSSLDVSGFNTQKVTDMSFMFWHCPGLTDLDVSNFNTENVTNMSSMFSLCSALTGLDVSNFNTSNVTNMSHMFWGCSGLTSLDVSNFNTSNVTNMDWMFYGCSALTSLDVSNFNTSNVTNMGYMFNGCKGLKSLDVSNFNTSNVTNMGFMFYVCSALTSLDVSNFNTSNVTNMGFMFFGCSGLTSLDVSSSNTSNVTDMTQMFWGCSGLKTIYVGSLWNTDKVISSDNMFSACGSLIGGDGTAYDRNYTDKTKAYAGSGGYLTLKQEAAPEAYAVLSTDNTTLSFYYDGKKDSREGTVYTADKFRTSSKDGWSDNAKNITTVMFDPSFGNYDGLTSTKYWFHQCESLKTIDGLTNLNTSNVKEMTSMFAWCSSLTSLDVSNFNTGKVWSMYLMFYRCSGLTSLDLSSFNTENVTTMEQMFSNCSGLTSLDVTMFNTTKVRDFSDMFNSCIGLTSLDVTKFDTSSATDIEGMFWGCTGLTSIDLSNFNTDKVTNFGYLFTNCTGLTSIDLSKLNTKNATSMSYTFYGCSNLVTIYVGDNWSTSKVTNSMRMFTNCTSLVGGDGTTFNSNSVDKTRAYAGKGGYLTYKSIYSYDKLRGMLDAVGTDLNWMSKQLYDVNTEFQDIAKWFDEKARGIMEDSLKVVYAVLEDYTKERTALTAELAAASESDYANLYKNIDGLATRVAAAKKEWPQTMNDVVEFIKEKAASGMQWYLKLMGENVNNDWKRMDETTAERLRIQRAVGEGYFLYAATEKFCTDSTQTAQKGDVVMSKLGDLGKGYNTLVNNASISSIGDIGIVYAKYDELQAMQKDVDGELREYANMVQALGEQLLTLTLTFPDTEDMFYTVAPKDIKDELQLGYKSNRGFVLTSAGIMLFEQKEGADFYLLDNEENYITLETQGDTVLLAEGTKEEAAIWTGTNLGNGSYTFYNQANKRYLGYSGVKVNNAIVAGRQRYAWTIEESELDDLQAFLNLLSEEEEESETETELTENDTLVIVLPTFGPEVGIPTTPVVFPKVIYPVVIKPLIGEVPQPHYFPIPAPVPGQRRPSDFHPVNIPRGSHVILDDVTFQDIVGGDHIIYVDGTVEININVDIFIDNWDRFIHCGPTGRVIWHPKRPATGAWPKVLNEGEFELADKDSFVGEVENTGTVTQKEGTIDRVINRKTYYFTGGIINNYRNFGTHHHQGGTVLTARNFEGATFNMEKGVIDNTDETHKTDTVFVNRGTFNFTGGIIRGWGSRLLYHAKGAKLRIDGGLFDFTHVTDYFIEAHDDFYIRGDYDYKPTKPILLEPKVIVNILYKWNYHFNVVFIGGRPAPRYPLFRGPANYLFTPEDFERIGWNLPNKRWRWYIDPKENTIEPRDEEVEDEDDLQAYLDWLAENQESESQSTEEEPQELELSTRTITITEPVVLPVGTHVLWRNGNFTPQNTWDWSNGKPVFEVPSQSSVRFNKVIFNFSNTTHYMVGGVPMQRRLMHVLGDFYFDANSYIKGYFDRTRAMADDYIPGAYIDLDPASRFFYSGGHLDNVVLRLNQVVNIYVTCSITTDLHLYVPSAYLTEGFRLLASDGKYSLKKTDLKNIVLHCTEDFWSVTIDAEGYVCLKRGKEIEQPMELAKGWNWASIGLGNINDLVSFLSPIADQVEEIKSQTQSLINDSKYGLIGNLTRLNAQDGYRFRMKQQKNVTWKGMGSLADDTPVSIVKGWNWIGYVPTFDLTLSEALSGLTPSEGDQIRGFDGFADYKNGVWIGSLTTMRQGESYQYYAVEAATFYYPMQKPAAQAASRAKEQNVQPKAPWTYDAHLYPDVQTMILRLCTDGKKIDGYNVAAFCNGECRGIAKQVDNLLFLTVHGTLSDNETIDLVAYDPKSNQAIEVEEAVDFNGQRWGDIDAPMLLNLGGVTTEIGTLASASISFTMEGNCLYLRGNTEGIQSIHIFSADGTQVYAAQGYATSGIALGTLSKGVYVVNITMTDNTTLRKKILW